MRTVIVYESMYGNTRQIAEEIAAGMAGAEVRVIAAHDVTVADVDAADLVVVGAPTHVHSLPRPSTRQGAVDALAKSPELALEPDATAEGVRELMERLPDGGGRAAAAFDTRIDIAPMLSGRASKLIARDLRHDSYHLVAPPESFLVDKHNHLLDGELERARAWGATVASSLVTMTP